MQVSFKTTRKSTNQVGRPTECPGHEASECLADTPPSSEKRQDMLLIRRQILKEDGDIEYQVAARSKGE
jgi:hypothetical protein